MAKKAASSTKKTTTSSAKKSATTVKTVSAEVSKVTTAPKKNTSLMSEFTSRPMVASGIAELIGTFMLTAVILTQQNQPVPLLFALIGIALVFAGISGAHVNPAITAASWITRRISGKKALVYVVAQFIGAMLAFVALNAFVKQAPEVSQQMAAYGQAQPELFAIGQLPAGKEWAVLFAEFLGASVLGLAYASALRKGRERVNAALTMAAGLFVAALLAGTVATYIGGSVVLNPAVAVVLQAFKDITFSWAAAIYLLTPAVAAVISFAIYDYISREEAEV